MTDLKTICERAIERYRVNHDEVCICGHQGSEHVGEAGAAAPCCAEKSEAEGGFECVVNCKTFTLAADLPRLAQACLIMAEALEYFHKDGWQPGFAYADQTLAKVEELFK